MANGAWIVYSPIDLVLPPIKITERSQATNIELGLQIPSGGVILTFHLLYFSFGELYIHHVHGEIFVEALNAIYRGWFGLTQLRKGLEVRLSGFGTGV